MKNFLFVTFFFAGFSKAREEENAVSGWWSSSKSSKRRNSTTSVNEEISLHARRILSEFTFGNLHKQVNQYEEDESSKTENFSLWSDDSLQQTQVNDEFVDGFQERKGKMKTFKKDTQRSEKTIDIGRNRNRYLSVFLRAESQANVDELLSMNFPIWLFQYRGPEQKQKKRICELNICTSLNDLPLSSRNSKIIISPQISKKIDFHPLLSDSALFWNLKATASNPDWYFDATSGGLGNSFFQIDSTKRIYLNLQASVVWNAEQKSFCLLYNQLREQDGSLTQTYDAIKATFRCNRKIQSPRLRIYPSASNLALYRWKAFIEGGEICKQQIDFIDYSD